MTPQQGSLSPQRGCSSQDECRKELPQFSFCYWIGLLDGCSSNLNLRKKNLKESFQCLQTKSGGDVDCGSHLWCGINLTSSHEVKGWGRNVLTCSSIHFFTNAVLSRDIEDDSKLGIILWNIFYITKKKVVTDTEWLKKSLFGFW